MWVSYWEKEIFVILEVANCQDVIIPKRPGKGGGGGWQQGLEPSFYDHPSLETWPSETKY